MNATANIGTNLHENGHSKLAYLEYFRHKDIVNDRNDNNCQTIVCSGAIYGDRTIKRLYGLVWRASKTKGINFAVLIEDNNCSDLV